MSETSPPFVLPADLNIYEAAGLKVNLLEWVQHGEVHELDGSAVERVDLAGLQAVLMLVAYCCRVGSQVQLVSASPVLSEALLMLGLDLDLRCAQNR